MGTANNESDAPFSLMGTANDERETPFSLIREPRLRFVKNRAQDSVFDEVAVGAHDRPPRIHAPQGRKFRTRIPRTLPLPLRGGGARKDPAKAVTLLQAACGADGLEAGNEPR
jgi:hypothetical protein